MILSCNIATNVEKVWLQTGYMMKMKQGNEKGSHLWKPYSYWCRLTDSNCRPTAYKAVALPTELKRRKTGVYSEKAGLNTDLHSGKRRHYT